MKRAAVLVACLGLLGAPQVWAGVVVHDDIMIDYVRTNVGNGINNGTAITFANGAGPFWYRIFDDSRTVGGDKNDPNRYSKQNSSWGGWVNPENRNGAPYTTEEDAYFTFCVESNEYFSPGSVYDIESFRNTSRNTNRAFTGYAAWVMDQFEQKLALGLNPRNPTSAQKTMLETIQKAIWAGMVGYGDANNDGVFQVTESLSAIGGSTSMFYTHFGYTVDPYDPSNNNGFKAAGVDYQKFLDDDVNWFGSDTTEYNMLRRWNGYQVINVQSNSGGAAQDQVITYGGSTGIVPEPGSIAVWSLLAGAAGVLAARRRRPARAAWSQENRVAIWGIVEGRRGR